MELPLDRDRPLDRLHAEHAAADEHLVARAAWEAARLTTVFPDWPPDDLCAFVYSVALLALRSTLSADAHAALRTRYHANRDWFVAGLVARGI
jgi:hypothetical protein